MGSPFLMPRSVHEADEALSGGNLVTHEVRNCGNDDDEDDRENGEREQPDTAAALRLHWLTPTYEVSAVGMPPKGSADAGDLSISLSAGPFAPTCSEACRHRLNLAVGYVTGQRTERPRTISGARAVVATMCRRFKSAKS
jgi:hypothetical protein